MSKSDPPSARVEGEAEGSGDRAPRNVEDLAVGIGANKELRDDGVVLPPGATLIINNVTNIIHNQGGFLNSGRATGVVGAGAAQVDLQINPDSDENNAENLQSRGSDENVDDWFDGTPDPRDRCLAIAISFLPGASLTAILVARDRLLKRLRPKMSAAKEGGFGRSRSAILGQVNAVMEIISNEDGEPLEIARFTDAERYDGMRRYIWEERIDMREQLVQWMFEQAQSTDVRTAVAIGCGIGACAGFAFDSLFDQVVLPIAKQTSEHAALAAGEALGLSIQTVPRSKERVAKILRNWAVAATNSDERTCAVRLCASSWGVLEIDEALSILHSAETSEPIRLFKTVQRAIDLYWACASLTPKAADHLVERLACGFARWDEGDKRSIVCILPMVHLAHAIYAEIGTLKAQRPTEAPLLLRVSFQTSDAFKAVAIWLERGVRNRYTRKTVRTILDCLLDRSRALGLKDAFDQLVEAMHKAANDDDGRSRIRYYAESWNIALRT
jgi:hypothetical protein